MPNLNHLLIAIFLSFAAKGFANNSIKLPDIGDSSGRVLSAINEQQYAAEFRKAVWRFNNIIHDPQINEYLEMLGYQLVAQSESPSNKFHFFILNEPSINAFALPGGVVGIHSGMFYTSENESELAAVLSHEIAHVTQHHIARGLESAQKNTIPTALIALGAIIAAQGNSDAIQASVIGGMGALQQQRINFTRSNEYEADRIGIQTLYRAEFNTVSMARIFERMQRYSRNFGPLPSALLLTHPTSVERIAEAKHRAQTLYNESPRDSEEFYLMKARLRALASKDPTAASTYFQRVIASEPEHHLDAAQYGYALSLQRLGKYQQASSIIEQLNRSGKNSRIYQLSLASIELDSGQMASALARYQRLKNDTPENYPVVVGLANAWQRVNQPDKAIELLKYQILRQPTNPELFENFARALQASGKEVEAIEASAEASHFYGRTRDGINLLKELRSKDLDYYQRARIESRIEEFLKGLPNDLRKNISKGKDDGHHFAN